MPVTGMLPHKSFATATYTHEEDIKEEESLIIEKANNSIKKGDLYHSNVKLELQQPLVAP